MISTNELLALLKSNSSDNHTINDSGIEGGTEELRNLAQILDVACSDQDVEIHPKGMNTKITKPIIQSDEVFQDFPFEFSVYRSSLVGLCLQEAIAEFLAEDELHAGVKLQKRVLSSFDTIMNTKIDVYRRLYGQVPSRVIQCKGKIHTYKIYDGRYYLYVKDFSAVQRRSIYQCGLVLSSQMLKFLLCDVSDVRAEFFGENLSSRKERPVTGHKRMRISHEEMIEHIKLSGDV